MREKYGLIFYIIYYGAIALAIYESITSSLYHLLFLFVIMGIFMLSSFKLKKKLKKEGLLKEEGRSLIEKNINETIKMFNPQYYTQLLLKAKKDEFDQVRSFFFESITLSIYGMVGIMACWGYYSMLFFPQRYGNIISMLVTVITFGFGIWYSTKIIFDQMTPQIKKAKETVKKDTVREKNGE